MTNIEIPCKVDPTTGCFSKFLGYCRVEGSAYTYFITRPCITFLSCLVMYYLVAVSCCVLLRCDVCVLLFCCVPLCCVVLCYVMLCCFECRVVLCFVLLYCFVLCCISVLCYNTLRCGIILFASLWMLDWSELGFLCNFALCDAVLCAVVEWSVCLFVCWFLYSVVVLHCVPVVLRCVTPSCVLW